MTILMADDSGSFESKLTYTFGSKYTSSVRMRFSHRFFFGPVSFQGLLVVFMVDGSTMPSLGRFSGFFWSLGRPKIPKAEAQCVGGVEMRDGLGRNHCWLIKWEPTSWRQKLGAAMLSGCSQRGPVGGFIPIMRFYPSKKRISSRFSDQ